MARIGAPASSNSLSACAVMSTGFVMEPSGLLSLRRCCVASGSGGTVSCCAQAASAMITPAPPGYAHDAEPPALERPEELQCVEHVEEILRRTPAQPACLADNGLEHGIVD